MIVIIIQNLVFGVIIDTFADLRTEKNNQEDMIKNTCFICGEGGREGEREREGGREGGEREGGEGRGGICSHSATPPGLPRAQFENKDVTFQQHIDQSHNVWNYLFFIVHLKIKSTTEFTGPESYVYDKIVPPVSGPFSANSCC